MVDVLRFSLVAMAVLGCAPESSPATSPLTETRPPPTATPADPGTEIDGATLTYLANEGVMLGRGGVVVVIDGLHRFYGEPYDILPAGERERLETGTGDYADVDVLVATHRHGDHFHPDATVRHLQANPEAVFVAAPQAVGQVRETPGATAVTDRVRSVEWVVGRAETFEHGGARLELLGLRHAGSRHTEVQNLGVVVTVGDTTLAHFGDADGTADNLRPFDLAGRELDAAVVPAWWVLEERSRAVIRDLIDPRMLFVAHVDATDPDAPATLAAAWPGAIVLHEKLSRHPLR